MCGGLIKTFKRDEFLVWKIFPWYQFQNFVLAPATCTYLIYFVSASEFGKHELFLPWWRIVCRLIRLLSNIFEAENSQFFIRSRNRQYYFFGVIRNNVRHTKVVATTLWLCGASHCFFAFCAHSKRQEHHESLRRS